ncbi:hypothetical protein B0H15DRAFT_1022949 [Mycena belliarum]|uniref:Uncharacterized protein n=1 Tax=Mycena belliarum TaxID=1033014 RepID=A0AAD6U3W2_9AGAR|nr:hypothetical protein B0H15DRAFT_1022949 [Mycena belliae]
MASTRSPRPRSPPSIFSPYGMVQTKAPKPLIKLDKTRARPERKAPLHAPPRRAPSVTSFLRRSRTISGPVDVLPEQPPLRARSTNSICSVAESEIFATDADSIRSTKSQEYSLDDKFAPTSPIELSPPPGGFMTGRERLPSITTKPQEKPQILDSFSSVRGYELPTLSSTSKPARRTDLNVPTDLVFLPASPGLPKPQVGWTGEWNHDDMQYIIRRLRMLK